MESAKYFLPAKNKEYLALQGTYMTNRNENCYKDFPARSFTQNLKTIYVLLPYNLIIVYCKL